jgi:hypothetical protein
MMKHEKKEPKKEEKQEKKGVFMAKGGDVKSPKKMAVGGMTALTQPPAPAPVKQKTPPALMPTPVKERPTAAPAPMPAPAPVKQNTLAERRSAELVAMTKAKTAQLKQKREMAQLQKANAQQTKVTQSDLANAPRAQQVPAGLAGLGQQQIAPKAGTQPTQEQALALQKAYTQAQQASAGTGGVGGPQAQQAQQARPTPPEQLPAMAKGGMVKKKSSMKGIINKFIK